jgi:hypothetical protein
MRKIFSVCLVIAALPCFAQQINSSSQRRSAERREIKQQKIDSLIHQQEEGVINYRTQTDFGVKLVSDGYGIFMDIGKAKSVKRSVLYQLEFGERKNAKEAKQSSNNSPDPAAAQMIFGKLNFVYYAKLGVQEQYLLANKANKHGVNITCNVGGGLSLAILRPYEYEVEYQVAENLYAFKYEQFNTLLRDTTVSFPIGGPSISQGWDDLSLTPGVYGKAAVRFDYGHYTKTVTALEIGISGEYYTKKIPIIYEVAPKQSYLSVYAAIIFGWRRK